MSDDDQVIFPSRRDFSESHSAKRPALMRVPTICEALMRAGVDKYAAEDIENAIEGKADQSSIDQKLSELTLQLKETQDTLKELKDNLASEYQRALTNVVDAKHLLAQRATKEDLEDVRTLTLKVQTDLEDKLEKIRTELKEVRKIAETTKPDYHEVIRALDKVQWRLNSLLWGLGLFGAGIVAVLTTDLSEPAKKFIIQLLS